VLTQQQSAMKSPVVGSFAFILEIIFPKNKPKLDKVMPGTSDCFPTELVLKALSPSCNVRVQVFIPVIPAVSTSFHTFHFVALIWQNFNRKSKLSNSHQVRIQARREVSECAYFGHVACQLLGGILIA